MGAIDDLRESVAKLDGRLVAVEKVAHVPFDFGDLVKRLEALERWRDFMAAATVATAPKAE